MRILPLFILPHTADASDTLCTQAQVTGSVADGTKGVYIVGGGKADMGCKVDNATDGDQFPLKWDLKIDETKNPNGTTGQWLHGESENYLTRNGHGLWATPDAGYDDGSASTTGADTFINMHLHGEQMQTGDVAQGNYCYCGNRGGSNVLGRGNWKKSQPVDISSTVTDVVWVTKADPDENGNFGDSKVCLCKSADVVDPLMEKVTDATKLLKHGEEGDPENEKVCSNLLYEFDGENSKPLAKICEKTEYCDQFGGTKVCVPKDDQLFITQTVANGTKKYTPADGTKKYCVRHMTGAFGDVDSEDKRAFRPRDKNDISAPECADGTYCNPYADSGTTRCLPNAKVLGDDNVVSAVRAKGKTDEHCLGIGKAGSKVCDVDTHLCNPHAETNADLCVESKYVFKHAEAGNPDATPVAKTTCIADNALHEKCDITQVCNYGADSPANVCLASAALVGTPTIAKGVDNWNAIKKKSLRQEPGTDSQLCMARASGTSFSVTTPGGKSFSKQCVKSTDATLAEVCNPNANSLADVCINKNIVVANHGDQVDSAANPPRVACIGDTHYKLVLAKDMICNMGVTNDADEVEIKVDDTLSGKLTENNIRKEGFNKVGEKVANAEIFKWCFDNTQAERCTDTQTCNTAGTYDDDTAWTKGTDANATCVDTEAIIEHGGKGDETKMYCLGQDTSEKYTKVETEDTPKDQCSRATGKLHKADEQLADGALFDAEKPTEERCFATASEIPFFYDANCKDKFVCNPTGSSSEECGSDDAPCSLSNICVHTDAQLTVGGKFDEEKATISICLVGKTANQCTAETPYCQEDGTCLETAASGSGGDDSSESENVSGSSTASLVGLSVAAILSA